MGRLPAHRSTRGEGSGELKQIIRSEARRLGFKLCGFAPVQPPPHGEFVRRWLHDGYAGTMSYLGRGRKKRLEPALVLPAARSVVTVGFPYRRAPAPGLDWREQLRGRIAAYASGPDYHGVVLAKLEQLAAVMRAHGSHATRAYVDTGPILEREWAGLGGLGWVGKNTMILHRHEGSWFFLGEIFTDYEFDPEPIAADHCGSCRRCLDLCPTGALQPGHLLDARLCLSYLTIEYRGAIPRPLRPRLGEWIFGCDICQEVCPWNEKPSRAVAANEALFPYLPELLALDTAAYQRRFAGSAVSRARRDCFVRNVAVVLGNTGNPQAVPVLAGALAHDASALVRAHAAWGLGQIAGAAARGALGRARRRESDAGVQSEIAAALERAPLASAAASL
ncbi:MAG: tRNA epoxyqueuosine(34) reductase QueG [Deltaproteobacteria bacterium]|nr:tRNA epoxyqueuosine(34) reductase QueG [Deltaproteobacteria bacterium]